MSQTKLLSRQGGFAVLITALLLALLTAMWASAALITGRSIELSSSSAKAQSVTYSVNFTADGEASAFVLDFCSNSPVIGQTCTPAAGFNASTASSTTSGFTDVTDLSANTVVVAGQINDGAQVAVDVAGITNPDAPGPLYARIVTYDDKNNAIEYESTNLGTGSVDNGSVAISITDTIGVSGAVLESLTFCVSGEAIAVSCAGADNSPPVLRLGEEVGDAIALSAEDVSEGSIYTQVSTNAASGVVVRLKSSAAGCGGLMRAGAPTACDITPALADDVVAGQARFGVKAVPVADTPGSGATGIFQPAVGSGYSDSAFRLNFVQGDGTGVTSTFGDPFLDTDGAPVNNKNMALTFGASVSNDTPAGMYSVDLSLIATGKF